MGTTIENFKGIAFVRISSMPKEQQERVWNSFEKEKIIKIIKDQALMNDCILYTDYASWQSRQSTVQQQTKAGSVQNVDLPIVKLAFK